jgi:hypothetical protein
VSEEARRMTEQQVHDWDEAPTVEVRVFRHGELVHTELCESEEQAALVVEQWSELDGVQCEVDDLTVKHRPGDIFEPEPAVAGDEDYPPAG